MYTSRAPSCDHAALTVLSGRKARGAPPVSGTQRQPSASGTVDPDFGPVAGKADAAVGPGISSGPARSGVRSTKSPAPTCFTHTWNGPPRSAMKTTNRPSGEIAASSSLPSKLVNGVNFAAASRCSNRTATAVALQPARRGRGEAQHDDGDAERHAPSPRRHDGDAGARRMPLCPRQDFQAERQIARRLKPHLARLLQAARDDARERRRHVGRQRLRRILLQDRGHRLGRGLARERRTAGQHLVEHRAEAEDVGARDPRLRRGPAPATCSPPCPRPSRPRSRSAGRSCRAARRSAASAWRCRSRGS